MKVDWYKIKIFADLAKYWWSWVMSTVTGLGVLKLLGLNILQITLLIGIGIPIIFSITWLHWKYLYPGEHTALIENNPALNEISETVRGINSSLKKKVKL